MTLADEFGKARTAAGLEIRFLQAEKTRSPSTPEHREVCGYSGQKPAAELNLITSSKKGKL